MDLLCSAAASVAFVGTFYIWPRERRFIHSATQSLRTAALDASVYVDRGSDETIRRRTISLGLCCAASAAYLARGAASSSATALQVRGVHPVLRSTASTLLLFAGPIADACGAGGLDLPESVLLCWRNYVICPIGEELFYRGVLLSLLRRRSPAVRIGVSAVLFALSHTHHLVSLASDAYREDCDVDGDGERCEGRERECWRAGARALCGVYVCTTLFGLMSGYYFEYACEGSLAAITAAHAVCNIIGPPQFAALRSRRSTCGAKVASAAVYVAGIAGWAWTLSLH
ncbi:CAAX prenyl protease 2 [Novymonas esmeraldas]|uniref:intramembrane prenyl-peptidase Rce1 n=1 Tax=Novymonas esmeraldas TaxID=1808958 RepID=A0AAW0EXT6_9TRYP